MSIAPVAALPPAQAPVNRADPPAQPGADGARAPQGQGTEVTSPVQTTQPAPRSNSVASAQSRPTDPPETAQTGGADARSETQKKVAADTEAKAVEAKRAFEAKLSAQSEVKKVEQEQKEAARGYQDARSTMAEPEGPGVKIAA